MILRSRNLASCRPRCPTFLSTAQRHRRGHGNHIPPHNIAEVVDATVYLIDHFDRIDEVGVNDLLQFIKGPDFPTGGILFRYRQGTKGEEEIDAISQGYAPAGRG